VLRLPEDFFASIMLLYFQLVAVDSACSGVSSGPYCILGNSGPSAFFAFFLPFFLPSPGSGDSPPAAAPSSTSFFFFFFPLGYGMLASTSLIGLIELLGPK